MSRNEKRKHLCILYNSPFEATTSHIPYKDEGSTKKKAYERSIERTVMFTMLDNGKMESLGPSMTIWYSISISSSRQQRI